ETQQVPTEEVPLQIYLSKSQKVTVNILTSDQTEDVLEAVASKLDLPDDLAGYFSLFLVREGVDGGLTFVRKLQDFELPYVSVTSLRTSEFHIALRKRYDTSTQTLTIVGCFTDAIPLCFPDAIPLCF
uniref:Ras-associating domain-containing protein n=1 Tax=Hucho hucho TaxID=62062 RepID=A0A4W5KT15_9TELE